ncbi:MAG: dihydrodipicolinate synthase family protein, partial [Caldilineaceae bacterium]|nr:dihydrodipicolinate synthase family protein [Caldilineaceae bacterium]
MNSHDLRDKLGTVVAIPVTPFVRRDNQLFADFHAYAHLVDRMISGGITVITPNGNTGEFYSLTQQEMHQAVAATVAGVAGRALVLAGVGFDVATAVAMAHDAAEQGAEAIMIHQPVHPYRSDEGWIAYHQAIAEAVPQLGIVPYVRDATIGTTAIRGLIERCPNFVGIKYAVGNPPLFAQIVQQIGKERLAWICGIAESWAPFYFVAGACGFTSGLVNVAPELSLEMQESLVMGNYDNAMRIWQQIKPFEDLRARRNNANNVSAVKEAMAQMGLCERTVRPPISELSENERAEVSEILIQLGVDAM